MKLNVRCCCTPTKILGTLEVLDCFVGLGAADIPVVEKHSLPLSPMDFSNLDAPVPVPAFPQHFVKLRRYGIQGEVAVYSEERTLEFWQRILGFVAGDVAAWSSSKVRF